MDKWRRRFRRFSGKLKFVNLSVCLLLGVSFITSSVALTIFETISHTGWTALFDFSLPASSSAAVAMLLFIAGAGLLLIAREIIFLLIVCIPWPDAGAGTPWHR
jgi:hypothetical protein